MKTTAPMTPDEFKETMQKIADIEPLGDVHAHITADNLMCQLLRTLGYSEGVEIFENMEKWYS